MLALPGVSVRGENALSKCLIYEAEAKWRANVLVVALRENILGNLRIGNLKRRGVQDPEPTLRLAVEIQFSHKLQSTRSSALGLSLTPESYQFRESHLEFALNEISPRVAVPDVLERAKREGLLGANNGLEV